MSILFEPKKLNSIEIKNRFVFSALYEGMARENGEITDGIVKRYRNAAKGQVGLIIPGYFYVHASGRAMKYQSGIHQDNMIAGIRRLVEAVHEQDSKIILQLVHAGMQTETKYIGDVPVAPSSIVRHPQTFIKPREITEDQIVTLIQAFGKSAGRAVEAGADGIQLHAAHGYLINQFLSPFYNQRKDYWGGSAKNRFRFLKETILQVRKNMPEKMPLLIKLNTFDHTPKPGITPELAATYADMLNELSVDGLELSCGTGAFSFMNMCRGDVPQKELLQVLPFWLRPIGKILTNKLIGKYDMTGPYNLDAAKTIRPIIPNMSLLLVGGMRKKSEMEEILQQGFADFISIARPLLREPFLVKKFMKEKIESASCISCNRCLAAAANQIKVRCYYNGFPGIN
jgi:2,4-dienoyl-CoA reductase-like NADH-dependent reductase (Old Yellow Enzyme family)